MDNRSLPSVEVAHSEVLGVSDLSVTYKSGAVTVAAVSGVNLSVMEGKVHAVVGESGSGKTSIASAILGTLPPTSTAQGSITFNGQNLLALPDHQRREIRGRLVSFIPQNPMTSLNPVLTVGYQMIETMRVHGAASKAEAVERAVAGLRQVGVPDPERALRRYPHEFSGGTAQRILIAIALINAPRLVVADEPTSALDATVQRQILDLLNHLVKTTHMTMLLISHDLGSVASLSDSVAVMYAGQIVEDGPAEIVLNEPQHPYTAALITSARGGVGRIMRSEINPHTLSTCRFLPRCPAATEICRGRAPDLVEVAPGHRARCYHAGSSPAVRMA
jgi:oligopeptide/dipeptide ABC transporter ATP-binding protein